MKTELYPLDFLQRQAIRYGLAPTERVVFLLLYGSERHTKDQVLQKASLTEAKFQKLMSSIYKKFGVDGRRRGKRDAIDSELLKLYNIEKTDVSHEVTELAALNVDIDVNKTAPVDQVAAELATFCKALNSCHIAYGGNGLEIDDWETLIAVHELVGI